MSKISLHIEDYMLPCFSKTFLGVECLGCGIQRSVVFLIHGQFWDAFIMYPAIYTLILLAGIIIFNFFKKNKNLSKIIGRLAFLNLGIILFNYFIKLII